MTTITETAATLIALHRAEFPEDSFNLDEDWWTADIDEDNWSDVRAEIERQMLPGDLVDRAVFDGPISCGGDRWHLTDALVAAAVAGMGSFTSAIEAEARACGEYAAGTIISWRWGSEEGEITL